MKEKKKAQTQSRYQTSTELFLSCYFIIYYIYNLIKYIYYLEHITRKNKYYTYKQLTNGYIYIKWVNNLTFFLSVIPNSEKNQRDSELTLNQLKFNFKLQYLTCIPQYLTCIPNFPIGPYNFPIGCPFFPYRSHKGGENV